MSKKQTPENSILTKLIKNAIQLLMGKLSHKKSPTQKTEASALELKQRSDMNKAKAKHFTTSITDKINRHKDHKIINNPTDKILLTTAQNAISYIKQHKQFYYT